MWFEQPITFGDVVHAVDQYAGALDRDTRAEFVTFECDRWLGVVWSEADCWDMGRDWVEFQRLALASR